MQCRCVLALVSAVVLARVDVRADHASVSLGAGGVQPFNAESGIPLERGAWSYGLRNEFIEFDPFGDAELRRLRRSDPPADLHSVGSILAPSLGVFYGVSDDLTLGLRFPYVRRSDVREPNGEYDEGGGASAVLDLGDPEGIGDATAIAQYRILRHRGSHVSLLGGLKVPAGRTRARAPEGFRLETELQPGSGSWDPLLGLAYSWAPGALSLHASFVYTIATLGAQETNLGDIASYGLALGYRLGGAHEHDPHGSVPHDDGPPLAWDLLLELSGEHRQRIDVGGEVDGNSGGNVLYFSPGLRLTVGSRLVLGASIGVPIATDFYGDQVDPRYRLVTSAGWLF